MSQENVEIAQRFYAAGTALFERAAAGADVSDAFDYWERDRAFADLGLKE